MGAERGRRGERAHGARAFEAAAPPAASRESGVDGLQRAAGNRAVQRLLAARVVQRRAGDRPPGYDAPPDVVHEAARRGAQTASTALPFAAQIQRSFGGHDVGAIRSHQGPAAADASAAMGASAYTTGDHVVFADTPDLRTTAHEAAHAVQQRAGVALPGGVGREGDAYERHADEVAARVVAGQSAEDLLDRIT